MTKLLPLLFFGCVACVQDIGDTNESSEMLDRMREFPPGDPTPPPPNETFEQKVERFEAMMPEVMARQLALLEARYDLGDYPIDGVTMTRGKPVQGGTRVRLPEGETWDSLSALTPDEIREADLFPAGFFPLPHPNHPEGGMVFPNMAIEEIRRQTGRDLERFDLDFDLPEHLLPEFPAAIFLTTRPDLGDVSNGELVTTQNFFRLFDGIMNEKQLDGLRMLVFPLPQQQFNLTDDRRSIEPQLGVACFDCHANGHSNGATHLVGDIRPQEFRHRLDTPSLRGVNIQRLFGSQRALRTIEDFTEFEQLAAYFDGQIDLAAKKGATALDRPTQIHHMAEVQEILDFPPAPQLDLYGHLIPAMSTEAQLRGEALFNGRARCVECHEAPYFTDNTMHNLMVERFYEPRLINGMMASADGPIKTFPLRGVRESPPYLHDGRLMTLADTIEFFNLVLELDLTEQEKQDLVEFLLVL